MSHNCGEDCGKAKNTNKSGLIEVGFKGNRRGWYLNRRELHLDEGEKVVVEAERGLEIGKIISLKGACCGAEKRAESALDIRRTATSEDLEREKNSDEREKNAFKIATERIIEYKLNMKLIDVEQQFDGNKMTFFFTAEQRVDFRELVKSLAGIYRTRIELRQVGVRDEAKRINGIGICGRPQCCSSFMDGFSQVTTQLAKDQQLSLNPSKISGNCGRLLCCLEFEEADYLEAYKELPRSGCTFTINGKKGTIVNVDTFKKKIQVRRFEEGMNKFEWYELEDIAKGEVGDAPEYKRR
jgi:cell fate regulator YaaT (PSP1 superfamily)